VLGLSKGTWHYRQNGYESDNSDRGLKVKVEQIIEDQPGYGYRRIRQELLDDHDWRVNHKRLKKLLNRWDLSIKREVNQPSRSEIHRILDDASGTLNKVQGHSFGPLEVLSGDFTEIEYANGSRKAWLMAMVDPESRLVAGWAVGSSRNRRLARTCFKQVQQTYDRLDVPLSGTIVHQDQDAVYTSYDWLHRVLIQAGCEVSFSERGAKGNPWIESAWSRFKEENESLLVTAQSLEDLREVIDEQFRNYNQNRRHSGLNYQSPIDQLISEGIAPTDFTTSPVH
jgi:transposase InsO family protein